jgi:hypothetical protein
MAMAKAKAMAGAKAMAKAKAMAMAKARVNVLVGAPEHSKTSIERSLGQTIHGKRGWHAHGEQTSSGQPKN